MDRFLHSWARLTCRWPALTVLLCLSLTAAAGWMGSRIEIDTDQDNLVSTKEQYYHRYKKDYLESFDDTEYLYAVIEVNGRPRRALAFAEDLCRRVRKVDGVKFARYRFDVGFLEKYPLHLGPDEDFEAVRARLLEGQDQLRAMAAARELADVVDIAADGMKAAHRERLLEGGDAEEDGEAAFGFLDGFLADMELALEGGQPSGEGIRKAFFPDARTHVALFDKDPREDPDGAKAKFLLVAIQTDKDFSTLTVIEQPLAAIRAVLKETLAAHPGIKAGLTGRPVLAADEMIETNRDMQIATSIAFTFVALIFMVFFRSVWRPLLVMLSLGAGIVLTFGAADLAVGRLNLLSMVFTVVLIGLGVDFGIHILARYTEELSRGRTAREAVAESLRTAGRGNLTGGFTTAAAFFATLLVDFQGLRELGLIAGCGVLLCLFTMHTLLPALLVLYDGRPRSAMIRPPLQYTFLADMARRRRVLCVLALALTAALALGGFLRYRATGTVFDKNLLNLQNPELDSVKWERKLRESDFSTWFAVFLAKDETEARRITAALKARPDVFKRVESAVDLLPPEGRKERLKALAAELEQDGAFQFRETAAMTASREEMRLGLARLSASLARMDGLLERFALAAGDDAAPLVHLRNRIANLQARIQRLSEPGFSSTRLAEVQMLSDYQESFLEGIKGFVRNQLLKPGNLTLENLKALRKDRRAAAMLERFIGRNGELAVMAFPEKDLWEPANLEAFHAAMMEIDPNATGVPVMVQRSIEKMITGFRTAILYALIAVVVLVFIDLRRPLRVLLALLPTALGMTWAAGLALGLGVRLNMANFFAVPMLLGIAVDSGVHLVHRWRSDPDAPVAAGVTGAAVSLTSLTTLIGFGSLSFSAHRGLASLGHLLVIGTAMCLLTSLVFLPALLKKSDKR